MLYKSRTRRGLVAVATSWGLYPAEETAPWDSSPNNVFCRSPFSIPRYLFAEYGDDRDLHGAIFRQVRSILEALQGMAKKYSQDKRLECTARTLLKLASNLRQLDKNDAALLRCCWARFEAGLDRVAFSQRLKTQAAILRAALFDYSEMDQSVDAVEFLDLLAVRLKVAA